MLRWARGQVGACDAEAFTAVWKRLDSVEDPLKYVWGVVRNTVLSEWRARKKRPVVSGLEPGQLDRPAKPTVPKTVDDSVENMLDNGSYGRFEKGFYA